MAASIGRVAIPFARRFTPPAAKKLVRELLMSAAPELIDVTMKKKSSKQAWKNIITKPQENNSVVVDVVERHQRLDYEEEGQKGLEKEKQPFEEKPPFKEKPDQRELEQIFFQTKKIANLLPNEATHSSLDLFEKQPLLITFENAFDQKIGPVYLPNGPMLEFEITGDRIWKNDVK